MEAGRMMYDDDDSIDFARVKTSSAGGIVFLVPFLNNITIRVGDVTPHNVPIIQREVFSRKKDFYYFCSYNLLGIIRVAVAPPRSK
jgi:hypothetical protein